MEALATKQIEKKKKLAQEQARIQEAQSRKELEKVSTKAQQHKLNQLFGLPSPPKQVYAIGKDSSAAVWWIYEGSMEEIVGWEISRYRKDHTRPDENIWHMKGYNRYEKLTRLQVIIDELSNDREYYFTVKSINEKGESVESEPSNTVMVEAVLPTGWYRFYDDRRKKFYYASIRTSRSSWVRPEQIPYYVRDDIMVNFTSKELQHLKSLYDEDFQHFNCIAIPQFIDLLSEIGEKYNKRQVSQLFEVYNKEDPLRILHWQEFMDIMNHIKQQRKENVSIFTAQDTNRITTTLSTNIFSRSYHALDRWIQRFRMKTVLPPDRDKLGNWVVEYNTFAKRLYYRNQVTKECSWVMPPEVKYYLPKALENQLQDCFTFGDLQEFQQFFALLDIDQSGDLTPQEIRTLLQSMGIALEESRFLKLISVIDSNQNGRIEYDEFCYLMLILRRQELRSISGGGGGAGGSAVGSVGNSASEKAAAMYQDQAIWGGNGNSTKFTFQNLQNAVRRLRSAKTKTMILPRTPSHPNLLSASTPASLSSSPGGSSAISSRKRRSSVASDISALSEDEFGVGGGVGSSPGLSSRKSLTSSSGAGYNSSPGKRTSYRVVPVQEERSEEADDNSVTSWYSATDGDGPGDGLSRRSTRTSGMFLFSVSGRHKKKKHPHHCMCGCRRIM